MKHLSVKFTAVANALDGKFGKRVLKRPYRIAYRVVVWTTLVWLAWTYIFVPFFEFWDIVINGLNHIIWG